MANRSVTFKIDTENPLHVVGERFEGDPDQTPVDLCVATTEASALMIVGAMNEKMNRTEEIYDIVQAVLAREQAEQMAQMEQMLTGQMLDGPRLGG